MAVIQPRDGARDLEADGDAGPVRPVGDQRSHVAARRIDGVQSDRLRKRPPLLAQLENEHVRSGGSRHARYEQTDRPAADDEGLLALTEGRSPDIVHRDGGRLDHRAHLGREVGRQRDEHSGRDDPARLHRPRRVDAEEVQVVADVRMPRAAGWAVCRTSPAASP